MNIFVVGRGNVGGGLARRWERVGHAVTAVGRDGGDATDAEVDAAAKSIAAHPIGLLRRLYFRVTVNTDNRLMSGTSMSREMALLVEEFGYGWSELQWFTINAMKSAFIPFDERLDIINTRIKPGYASLMA